MKRPFGLALAFITCCGLKMKFRQLRSLVVLGILFVLAGCQASLEKIHANVSPTVDLSRSSTEKSELVDYCNCITRIEQETDDGTHLIWSLADELFGSFVLSPGRYRVRAWAMHSTTTVGVKPVAELDHEFVFEAKPGHTYKMHSRQHYFWEYSVVTWLKDATSGEIIEKASTVDSD